MYLNQKYSVGLRAIIKYVYSIARVATLKQ